MIGFVIALASESPDLLKKIPDVHTSVVNGYEVYVLKFLNSYVCLVYSGVGKVNAAMATQTLIDHFKVHTVINIGSCGSLVSNVNVGDIVLPNMVSYYDVDVTAFGYKPNQIPKQPADFLTDKDLNEKILDILNLYPNHLSHGKLISGDTFLNQTNIQRFHLDEKAVVVDMESAAILQTCSQNKVTCSVIKIVSDQIFTSTHNNKEWHKNIDSVAKTIDKIVNDVSYFLIYNQNK
jgi:adenosylhomocysteine nucleosidase